MILHNLKTAYRNLLKHKASTLISIIGLAMGVVCFVYCFYCARMIFSSNNGFPNRKRIAEILLVTPFSSEGSKSYISGTPVRTIEQLKDYFPGVVERFTCISYPRNAGMYFETESGHSFLYMMNIIEADSNFNHVFSIRLISGNWQQTHLQENAVILSQSMARKVFGNKNPLGKVLHPNELYGYVRDQITDPDLLSGINYVIMGVMEDLPVNNSISFMKPIDALFINDRHGALSNFRDEPQKTGSTAYALLYPGVDFNSINQQLNLREHAIPVFNTTALPDFQPLGKGAAKYRRLHVISFSLSGIGLLILLVAFLNFFTFISNRFLIRIKEFGIRKGAGSDIKQLYWLLFSEVALLLLAAWILAACLVELSLPALDLNLGKINFNPDIKSLLFQMGQYLIAGMGISAVICWGITIRLHRMSIRQEINSDKHHVRNLMLWIQLVISILFFTGGITLYFQTRKSTQYILSTLNKKEKEHILELRLTTPPLNRKIELLTTRFGNIPGVSDILLADHSLLDYQERPFTKNPGSTEIIYCRQMNTGENFRSFLNIRLLEGGIYRNSKQLVADKEIVRFLDTSPIGSILYDYENQPFDISGISETVSFTSYREDPAYKGAVLWLPVSQPLFCYIKIIPEQKSRIIAEITEILGEYIPNTVPFQIPTLQEVIERENYLEYKARPVILLFSIICLFITILGIYSAISWDTERRKKEVAIRKINGAGFRDIALLFIRLYLWLFGTATLLTLPVLWTGVHAFLSLYSVRFNAGPLYWIFIYGCIAVLIGMTIAGHIVRIMRINPAEILKTE